jgi:hypothetical protein
VGKNTLCIFHFSILRFPIFNLTNSGKKKETKVTAAMRRRLA